MTNRKTQPKFNQDQYNQKMDKKFEEFRKQNPSSTTPDPFDCLYEFAKTSFVKANLLPQEQFECDEFIIKQTEKQLSCDIADRERHFSKYLELIGLLDPFKRYLDHLNMEYFKATTPTIRS